MPAGERESIFIRMGKGLGIIKPSQKLSGTDESTTNNSFKEKGIINAQLLDALVHSDACSSEIEYVLGLRTTDPHPNHSIQYHPDFPPPEFPYPASIDSNSNS